MFDPVYFPNNRYDVLLLDPPWSYYGAGDKWAAAAKEYSTISDEYLGTLPVADWLERNSVVFLWATGPRMDAAIDMIRHWGLHFRGTSFVWVKTRQDGKPIGAQGVRPSIVKPTTEFVLAASPRRKGRPLPLSDEGVPQVVLAPRRAHSQKPEEVQDRIDRLYPNMRKAELFARRRRDGWSCFGDELPTTGAAVAQ